MDPARRKRLHYLLLASALVLSSYVHVWNPAGFPDIFFDEGVYMRRAVNMIETGSPQEGGFYDHPYWGQMVLAGVLWAAGLPEAAEQDLELTYMVPRVLMGALAVLDTLLIYKITEKRFGRRAAAVAAILFAVMPVTWMLRRILLDTILLPFMLSSVLLAMHSGGRRHGRLLVAGSAALLGLAIFTKVTAVTMIPVVGYLVYSARGGRPLLGWLGPVLAIPMAWPAAALALGQLDSWMRDVLWQAGRGSGGMIQVVESLFRMDPVSASIAAASLAFAAYRRDAFLLLWSVPFLVFVGSVGFLQYFHFVLVFPAACAAAGLAADCCLGRIRDRIRDPALVAAVAAAAVFGGISSGLLVSEDLTAGQFRVMGMLGENLDGGATLLAGPVYSWVASDVLGLGGVPPDYSVVLFEPAPAGDLVLVADPHFVLDIQRGQPLADLYDGLERVALVEHPIIRDTGAFPYGSLSYMGEGREIEIRDSRGEAWAVAGPCLTARPC
ncbi:MAG: glycosyltransferase family 39 protein [Nitrosopumilus sp.]|nr:glycosyltransferase family 39 protein [Nitrosopumilus sp.]